MGYDSCLELVCNKIKFSTQGKETLKRFHRIRYEIQHRALNLPLEKEEEIGEFYPILKEFYEKMFEDGKFPD